MQCGDKQAECGVAAGPAQQIVKPAIGFLEFRSVSLALEPSQAILERGEKVSLPPALVYQGTADEWTTVELAQRFAADYRSAGGSIDLELLEGERHTFVNEHPFAANSVKAVKTVQAFIKKYGSGQQATRSR